MGRLGGITAELEHVGRSQVGLVELDMFAPIEADQAKCCFNKVSYRAAGTSGDSIVTCLILRKHQPHCPHVVARVAPIALSVEVAHAQLVQLSGQDLGDAASHLSGDEVLAPTRRLMVEQDSAAREDAV